MAAAIARNRRCKERDALPQAHDWIEVLWDLDDPAGKSVWWRTEVLRIDSVTSDSYLALGTLEYEAGYGHPSEIIEVEFVPGRLVKVALEKSEREKGEENDNPALAWRTTQALLGRDAIDLDFEWTSEAGGKDRGHGKKRRLEDRQDVEDLRKMVKSLRRSQAKLVAEFFVLKDQVKANTSAISQPREDLTQKQAEDLFSRIRERLALQFEKKLRHVAKAADNEVSQDSMDGILRGSIRAKVDCNLELFEQVTRVIYCKSVQTSAAGPQFFPEYCATQHPNLGSKDFFVMFPSFGSICDYVGIQSSADRREMVQKVVAGPKGNICRVLGSYVFESDDSKPAAFFFGKSCGRSVSSGDTSGATERNKAKVLLRDSRKWNAIDCKFVDPLVVSERIASPVPDPTKNKGVQHDAFSLIWRRSREISPRIWSKNMLDREHVNGSLTVSLPYMQVCGDMLCDEIGKLLSDEWISGATR